MTSPSPTTPPQLVCPWILRTIWNDDQYLERTARRELTQTVEPGTRPDPRARLPSGTLSHSIWFRDRTDKLVARAHQYLLHGQPVRARDQPDPKSLFEPDGTLTYSHGEGVRCSDCAVWEPLAHASLRRARQRLRRVLSGDSGS